MKEYGYLRGLEVLSELMFQLSCRVDGEYARDWDANSAVGICILEI